MDFLTENGDVQGRQIHGQGWAGGAYIRQKEEEESWLGSNAMGYLKSIFGYVDDAVEVVVFGMKFARVEEPVGEFGDSRQGCKGEKHAECAERKVLFVLHGIVVWVLDEGLQFHLGLASAQSEYESDDVRRQRTVSIAVFTEVNHHQ